MAGEPALGTDDHDAIVEGMMKLSAWQSEREEAAQRQFEIEEARAERQVVALERIARAAEMAIDIVDYITRQTAINERIAAALEKIVEMEEL